MLTDLLKAAKSAAKAAHDAFFATLYEENAYRRGRWLSEAESADQCYLRAIALGYDVPGALRIVNAWRLARNVNAPLRRRGCHIPSPDVPGGANHADPPPPFTGAKGRA